MLHLIIDEVEKSMMKLMKLLRKLLQNVWNAGYNTYRHRLYASCNHGASEQAERTKKITAVDSNGLWLGGVRGVN